MVFFRSMQGINVSVLLQHSGFLTRMTRTKGPDHGKDKKDGKDGKDSKDEKDEKDNMDNKEKRTIRTTRTTKSML